MLGLDTLVEVGLQTDANFNTTARQALNVYSISGGQTQSRPQDNILGGGFNNQTDPTQPAPGLPDHRVTIEAPFCVNQLQYWMRLFFGAPVTDATGDPNFEHAFKTGVATLPIVSIQQRRTTGDFARHRGCVGEEFKIKLDPAGEGFARFSMTFVGMEETQHNATAAGTVTAAPALDRPAERLASVLYNAVAGGQIISGELTFKRKLKKIRRADGTGNPTAIQYDGKSELSGSLRCRYENQTMLADARSSTERSVALELLKNADRGARFTVGHGLLDVVPVGADGPDGIEIDIPLQGYQTPTDAAMLIDVLSALEDLSTF